MRIIMVIDGGTTAFKVALFDESLVLQGLARCEFEILRPTTEHAELEPRAYWMSCTDTIREVLRNSPVESQRVAAIAVTSHTDTLFALDGNDEPVCPAILWSDPRAQGEAERIQQHFGRERLYRETGQTGASSVHFASRLAWFFRNQNKHLKNVKRFLQTQDFLIYRLCGEAALDHSISCCSLLGRLEKPEYWPEMLDYLGIQDKNLSRIVSPGQSAGQLKPEVARALGLPAGIPIITGAMDATAAIVAIRSIAPQSITETTGAALVMGASCDRPKFDPGIRVPCFAHAIPGEYLLLPWCETAGAALRWYRDQFFLPFAAHGQFVGSNLYERITAEAEEAPPGCDGLVLLPHFAGSGSPDFNPSAKACLYGLTLGHQRKHISRAFLESVAYLVKQNLDLLADVGVKMTSLTCSGGGSLSPLWCQIKADVTGLPVQVCPFPEATATGAAMLAARALHGSNPEPEFASLRYPAREFTPNPSVHQVYQDAYQRFTRLNHLLQSSQQRAPPDPGA